MSNADRMPPHQILVMIVCLLMVTLLVPSAKAQLIVFSKQDLVDYTPQNPFDRFPDGRPKVPDDLIARARGLSSEEVWAGLSQKGFNNQYADGFQILHPGPTMVGRAFTVQFMPRRGDVDGAIQTKAKARGITHLHNQTAIDMVQPGDEPYRWRFGCAGALCRAPWLWSVWHHQHHPAAA